MIVSRYIELNPVRARMVNHPAEYPWSSYRHNAVGKSIKLVTPHPLYNALGNDPKERQVSYRKLFKDNKIEDYTLEDIRSAANKSWVLGDCRFKAQIETQLGRQIPPFRRGGDRKSKSYNPSLQWVSDQTTPTPLIFGIEKSKLSIVHIDNYSFLPEHLPIS